MPNNRVLIGDLMRKIVEIQNDKEMVRRYEEMRKTMEDLKKVRKSEEKYWFQRSKVNWINYSDKNTRYFHQVTRQRR